jgi:hypothetical protein
MKLSDLPAAIEAWMRLRLPPVTELTKEPRINERSLHIPPATDITYVYDGGALRGACSQAIVVQLGLSGGGLYRALDLPSINALYQGIGLELLLRGSKILLDITQAKPESLQQPISVEETSNGLGWVATLIWQLRLEFIASAETYGGIDLGGPTFGNPDLTPFDPTRIDLAIWKAKRIDNPLDEAYLDYGDRAIAPPSDEAQTNFDFRNDDANLVL